MSKHDNLNLYCRQYVVDLIVFMLFPSVGSWLKINGEAIYKSKPWKYQNDSITKDAWLVTIVLFGIH